MNTMRPWSLNEIQEIIDFPNQSIAVIGRDGTFFKVNEQMNMLGWYPEELIGKKVKDFIHPENLNETSHLLDSFFSGKRPLIQDYIIRCVRKDGSYLWMSWSGKVKGDFLYCIGADISAKMKETEAIQSRFKTFFEQSVLPMEIFDLDGNLLEVNQALCDLFHLKRSDFDGHNILNNPISETLGMFPYLKRAYAGEAVEMNDILIDPLVMWGQIEKPRWLDLWLSPVKDENGKVKELAIMIKDVTARKETEEKLKLAELDQRFLASVSETLSNSFKIYENLQKMGEAAGDYFCDGCFIDQLKCTGEIERIIVTHKNELIRETIFNLNKKYPQRYSHDHLLFNVLVTGKTDFVQDIRTLLSSFREKFGEEYFNELSSIEPRSLVTVRLKGRDSLLGTISFYTLEGSKHKFTDRHKYLAEEIGYRASMALENSLLYMNSQAAIRTRDEFLSIASHELKTPLTSLTLQNQIKKRFHDRDEFKKLPSQKLQRMLDTEEQQLRRINRLIDDMLDITRIRSERLQIHKESFEFTQFIKDVTDRFAPQLNLAGCELSFRSEGALIVQADLYRIEQVVVNILTNAMKYAAGRPIEIEVTNFSHKVCLMVKDHGPGIDQGDLERIFQRFERAVNGREISGLGLGLYIARQIVEQHEGTLFAKSILGKGSSFFMELPL